MKTIICDIDGTITNMWPIEKSVLLYMINIKFEQKIEQMKSAGITDYDIFLYFSSQKISQKKYIDIYNQSFFILLQSGRLPVPEKYYLVQWIFTQKNKYRFVYATGGQRPETLYVLRSLGLTECFTLEDSIDKTVCRFSKKTGIPFRKIRSKFNDCILISDSKSDCNGAALVQMPFILVKPKQNYFDLII